MQLDRDQVFAALREGVHQELVAVERVAAMARDEVASDETRSEGKYDTRATEASYLARGQAWRVAELRRLVAWFDTFSPRPLGGAVQVGSLVLLDGPRQDWVFVAPTGGASARVDGQPVHAISPSSPLGQALCGLEAGDAFEVDSPKGLVTWEILQVL